MKETKGISLVALVVTIIVLVILTSIVIILSVNNDGVTNRAKKVVFKSDIGNFRVNNLMLEDETKISNFISLAMIIGLSNNIEVLDFNNILPILIL